MTWRTRHWPMGLLCPHASSPAWDSGSLEGWNAARCADASHLTSLRCCARSFGTRTQTMSAPRFGMRLLACCHPTRRIGRARAFTCSGTQTRTSCFTWASRETYRSALRPTQRARTPFGRQQEGSDRCVVSRAAVSRLHGRATGSGSSSARDAVRVEPHSRRSGRRHHRHWRGAADRTAPARIRAPAPVEWDGRIHARSEVGEQHWPLDDPHPRRRREQSVCGPEVPSRLGAR